MGFRLLLWGSGQQGQEHGEVRDRWIDRQCGMFYYSSGNFIGCLEVQCAGGHVSGVNPLPREGFSPSHAGCSQGKEAACSLGEGLFVCWGKTSQRSCC